MCPSFKFQLFGFLDLYTVFMLVGVIACLVFIRVLSDHRKLRAKWQNLVLFNALAAVVLGYGSAVLFQAFYNYMDGGKFEVASNTGATFYGGLIGGTVAFIVIYFVAGRFLFPDGYHKRHFADVADMAAPCITVAHGFGRLGCLMAGCCHGPEVDPEAWYAVRMYINRDVWVARLPVQLFEAVFLFALCAVLIFLYIKRVRGVLGYYMVLYGLWRIPAEIMRDDHRGATVVDFLTPSQLISVLLILGGMILLGIVHIRSRKQARTAALNATEDAQSDADGGNADGK